MKSTATAQATVVKAAGIIVIMNLMSRVLGFIRDAVIAYEFGASGATDAYLVAYTLPYALQAVLGMAFVSVIVPVITSYFVKEDYTEAWRAGSIVLNWTIIILAVITLLGITFASQLVSLISPGFSPEQKILTTKLTRIIFPSILFMGTGLLLTGFLNAGNIFGIPAFAPALTNIIIILSVIIFGSKYRIEGLAVGTLAGFIGFFLIQIPALKKLKFKYSLNFNYHHPAFKHVAFTVIPVTLSVAVNQAYLAVNRIFASGLSEGSITSLDYAYRLMSLPVGIFVMAIATAVYPEISRRVAEKDYAALGDSLIKGLKQVIFISLPAAVGLIVLRFPVVQFVFERGAFDARATAMTADALLFFCLGLLGVGCNIIVTRTYYAMDNVKVPLVVGLVSVGVNILLSLLFIPFLEHSGLALANSIAATFSVLLLLIFLKKYLPKLEMKAFVVPLLKMSISAIIMGIVVFLIKELFTFVGASFVGLAVKLILLVALGALTYSVAAYLFKIEELQDILNIFLRKIKKA